jgi:hypothetical protein
MKEEKRIMAYRARFAGVYSYRDELLITWNRAYAEGERIGSGRACEEAKHANDKLEKMAARAGFRAGKEARKLKDAQVSAWLRANLTPDIVVRNPYQANDD